MESWTFSSYYERIIIKKTNLNMNLLRTLCKSALFKNRFLVETFACSYSTGGCCVGLSIARDVSPYRCWLK
ncbi:hypothetical protein T03_10793 [Trichinella britovi]|uniref:Uncharacterized protein n=1 Tax=Trichinella britovi TaxID=45882 RepID=A0A0V1C803_TRIBR|nr:hypothetical protein T03_10793 [Trichinella britovi]